MYLLAAISIGFLGSLHCVGMCGPLLFAVNRGRKGWGGDIFYHSGRLLIYSTFGAIAGAIGQTFDVMGGQQTFSLVVGSLVVLSVILIQAGQTIRPVEQAIGRFAIRFSGWIHASGLSREQVRFLAGIANGLLPCGMVYLALAGAANTFTPWDGALFMLAFGAGTIPALVAVSWVNHVLPAGLAVKMRKLVPLTMLAMGLLLMARGLDLGIPYLSPKHHVEAGQLTHCR